MSDDQLVRGFVTESQEHLADIENDILAIEAGVDQVDHDLVNKVFRAVHSIKGAAGFLGLATIGELAHSLENVLNLVRNDDLRVTSAITDVLLRAADMLRTLINDVGRSNGAEIAGHVDALQAIVAGDVAAEVRASLEATVAVTGATGPTFQTSAHALQAHQRAGHHLYVLTFDLLADVQERDKTPVQLIQELAGLGETLDSALDADSCGDLSSDEPDALLFRVLFATVLEPALIPEAFEIAEQQVDTLDFATLLEASSAPAPEAAAPPPSPTAENAAPPPPPRPRETPAPTPSAANAPAPAPTKPADTNIRVSVALLDHLMNLAGELVLTRNQLLQAISQGRGDDLLNVGTQVDRITSELQESIMQTRMQPIAAVFSRFPRVVRDLSGQLGKQCELVLEGQEVELDKSIIETIGDPLTHLVRNAVDHGVETPAERTTAGKPPTGTITLRAYHQAGKVNIEISDDGAGIDPQRLKQKAIEKSVLTAERAAEMGDREALRLIFHAGFSTAKQVTDVSGRGVGMDVVKTNIEKLGGTVDIESTAGSGTTIHVRLPLTLAIIPALIVRSGEQRFALPQVNISELVRVKPSELRQRIERVKDVEVLRLRGTLLPLLRLSQVLNQRGRYFDPEPEELREDQRIRIADRRETDDMPAELADLRSGTERRRDSDAGTLSIVILESGHLKYGLIVDALYDSEEIVVKPLGRHVGESACLAGATILGDGSVALILDVAGIASTATLSQPEEEDNLGQDIQARAEQGDTQAVLVFSNHPGDRFGVPMGLITRIERIRSEQIDHVGGQAVLQYRGHSLPLLALEDHVRAERRPDTTALFVIVFSIKKREVGLLATRLEDIREIPMQIDTTTFAEPGILGSAIIDDQATRLVDLWAVAEHARPEWFAEREVAERRAGPAPRILLAEDSDFFRRQITTFIESEGYEVSAHADGALAWHTLCESDEPFDLVITDIEMPNMDGLQLTRQIRSDKRWEALPIIAVTSLAAEADIERGHSAGVSEYQVKLDRDELMGAIARQLKSARRDAAATVEGGAQ